MNKCILTAFTAFALIIFACPSEAHLACIKSKDADDSDAIIESIMRMSDANYISVVRDCLNETHVEIMVLFHKAARILMKKNKHNEAAKCYCLAVILKSDLASVLNPDKYIDKISREECWQMIAWFKNKEPRDLDTLLEIDRICNIRIALQLLKSNHTVKASEFLDKFVKAIGPIDGEKYSYPYYAAAAETGVLLRRSMDSANNKHKRFAMLLALDKNYRTDYARFKELDFNTIGKNRDEAIRYIHSRTEYNSDSKKNAVEKIIDFTWVTSSP